jgi:hypothetical protein
MGGDFLKTPKQQKKLKNLFFFERKQQKRVKRTWFGVKGMICLYLYFAFPCGFTFA